MQAKPLAPENLQTPKCVCIEAPSVNAFDAGKSVIVIEHHQAVIVTVTGAAWEAILIVELTDPTYEPGTGTVTYAARELQSQPESDALASLAARRTDAEPGESFGPVTLFIDQLTCLPEEAHWT